MQLVELPNSTHTLPAGSVLQHKTSANRWIEVTLGVARKKALPNLSAIENKKPRDREYMTREELITNYGASEDALDKITAFAHEHHLQVTHNEPGASRIRLAGTVQDISSAFGVTLFDYHHDKLGDFHAHTGPVLIPSELRGDITGVFGFNNYRHLRRGRATRAVSVLTPAAASTSTRRPWFWPPELAGPGIYNFPSATGEGQCIGLLEFGGGVESDSVTAYFRNSIFRPPK